MQGFDLYTNLRDSGMDLARQGDLAVPRYMTSPKNHQNEVIYIIFVWMLNGEWKTSHFLHHLYLVKILTSPWMLVLYFEKGENLKIA